METFEHLLYQLHLSYLQARKNKRNTHNQLAFELNQETNLHQLAKSIFERKYMPKPCIAFIIQKPVMREIFAADFTDGHQCRNSATTTTLSTTDVPANSNFILNSNSPYNWRNPLNINLWQGVNGINNPCPSGYRVPTEAEWNAERLSWASNNDIGAFGSPLKLPVAGCRSYSSGSLLQVGVRGYYWGSSASGTGANSLLFRNTNASMSYYKFTYGFSVRCIKA